MTARTRPADEPKSHASPVNPVVKAAAEQVAAGKARRRGKDLRGDGSDQLELDLFAPEPKTTRRRRK
ncbi:MAG: hypothetical protein JWN03_1480 [Nocardia sp.]|uniref:hypothetical protein n=1 Tax=Nocardia sp. TaxID=1821 RepID=UPI00260E4ACE|nr:hypothetical protein [Nocardia sp.]MCU1641205.1 hypothetical protein [Nocardia sp.]